MKTKLGQALIKGLKEAVEEPVNKLPMIGPFVDTSFGALLTNLRLKNNLTLRDVCRKTGFNPGNWSKVERNLRSPPMTKNQLLEMLKPFKYTQVYFEFMECACVNHNVGMAIKRWNK